MAEQLTLNQWVQGSSPWSITDNLPRQVVLILVRLTDARFRFLDT